jgi:HK97 gp10 family phage protein
MAPKDTGFMADSIYISTADESTYGSSGSPPEGAEILPEEKPDDDLTAIVGVAASYGAYVELGTRFAPAQPYLVPAAETIKGEFADIMAQALEEGLSS